MTQLPFEDTKPRTGTRLSDSWIPTDADVAYATKLGMSEAAIAVEGEKFLNYWTSLPGQKARKLHWDRTWQNWVRKDYTKETSVIREMQRVKRSNHSTPKTALQLEQIASHVRRDWYTVGSYPRDVLEQCVAAGVLTKDVMEEKS